MSFDTATPLPVIDCIDFPITSSIRELRNFLYKYTYKVGTAAMSLALKYFAGPLEIVVVVVVAVIVAIVSYMLHQL